MRSLVGRGGLLSSSGGRCRRQVGLLTGGTGSFDCFLQCVTQMSVGSERGRGGPGGAGRQDG